MNVRFEATWPDRRDQRGRAPRYLHRTTSCAPRWSTRRSVRARTPKTTPGDHLYRHRARRPSGHRAGRQGRRLGKQVQVHHPQPKRQHRRLGGQDAADDGRRLVPTGVLGIGIGGTAEKAMLLAKESLMSPIDIDELKARGPPTRSRNCAWRSSKGQRAGHRRPGLGGLTTVVDVKIMDYRPTPPRYRSA